MKRKLLFLSLLFTYGLLLGMAGPRSRGELRPELRLKIYNEAVRYYEKAEALHRAGEREKALAQLRKGTRVVAAFPEAYALAERIYSELGDRVKAREQEGLYARYNGRKGSSLYELRDAVAREVRRREQALGPPDFRPRDLFVVSAAAAAILIFGMIFEYRRLLRPPEDEGRKIGIILEKFPGEEEPELTPSWLFKLCVLFLPAPFIASLLAGMGLRYWSDFGGPFLLSWVVVAGVVYTVFFADLSGFSGFRRPGAAG